MHERVKNSDFRYFEFWGDITQVNNTTIPTFDNAYLEMKKKRDVSESGYNREQWEN